MADRVAVIGWDGSPLNAAARAALGAATLVAGAAHHLALPEVPPDAERVRLGSVALAARRIAGHRGTAVVLADGDPGFFGVVRTLRAPEFGLEVEVVPAVSAFAAAFARAGMPWDDARIVVAHRRTLRRAVNVCRAHSKVAVLTAPGAGPAELALLLGGVHRTFVICEQLGTDQERVTVLTSDKVADHIWRDPNVVIVVGGSGAGANTGTVQGSGWIAGYHPGHPHAPRGWARHVAEYTDEAHHTGYAEPARHAEHTEHPEHTEYAAYAEHAGEGAAGAGNGPGDSSGPGGPGAGGDARHSSAGAGPRPSATATKGESSYLRAAQLAALGPGIGDLVWDIGAGSGALATEAARFGAAVIAVDRSAEACARTRTAARRCGVELQILHGVAPHILEDLPEPDVIRVGGGGQRTLIACADRRPERIVTHAVTRDEAEAMGRVLGEAGYAVECALLQSVELDTRQWAERERAVVFLVSGSRA